jgi:hypothetical protein
MTAETSSSQDLSFPFHFQRQTDVDGQETFFLPLKKQAMGTLPFFGCLSATQVAYAWMLWLNRPLCLESAVDRC